MIEKRRSLKRKKYQRDMNKLVRGFNKSIQNDWLWNGRFVMRQRDITFIEYEDKSGMIVDIVLELIDTKTGHIYLFLANNYNASSKIWFEANRIICDVWKVWDEDPNPNAQARLEGRSPN